MAKNYKYEKYQNEPYNISTKLVDENADGNYGNKVVIHYRDQKFTYKDVQKMMNKAANALKSLGVRQDDRVMIVTYDSPEFVAVFFGAIKIGAIPIPVNYMFTADDYRYLLNDSRARTLVVHEDFTGEIESWRDELKYLESTIVVGNKSKDFHLSFPELMDKASDMCEPAYTIADDFAFMLYSSGSTGTPKGAMHLQHDPFFSIESYAKGVLELDENDVVLSASKCFFAYGLGNNILFPFGTHAASILLPDRPLPETILATITKYKPTVFAGVPTLYGSLLQAPDVEKKYDLSSVKTCASAGEALPSNVFNECKKRFNWELLDGIGSTEMLHIFISNRKGKAKVGSTGMIAPGYEAKIVDDDGNTLPFDEVGTLMVKGDSAAAFYWRQHAKTKSTMIGEWLNTGDKYVRDVEGFFYYSGRGDDMLKVGGIWVSPIEIEDCLMNHPSVLECGVVGAEDAENLIKPKAFVVLKSGYQASDELTKELQVFVKSTIAPYKYPRWIQFIDELPKTTTGKIQRFKLRQM
jgi:benzoate-CoA ligase family protein